MNFYNKTYTHIALFRYKIISGVKFTVKVFTLNQLHPRIFYYAYTASESLLD